MSEKLSNLGPYSIESTLGQGGMGIVYRATDVNLGREVAIKVLHPHLLRHENLKQRFRREARMHAKLMHPNIVTLLSLYEDESHMALVMELVKGQDLKIYLRANPTLALKKKLQISINVLSGLEAAHKFGMVHRDLKPANVLVSDSGEAKLLDFGLAKPEQGEDDLTQSGATVGSFRYMAPEQILNNPIDARTDLYAFGILLFYMTVGKLPFDSSSNGGEFEIMEKQVREPAPIPHEINPNIPQALSQLILKLLEKNKHERPESAASVRKELISIQENLEQGQQQVETAPAAPMFIPEAASAPSNQEVAQQWIQHAKEQWQIFSAGISTTTSNYFTALKIRLSGLLGITSIFVLLGILVIIVLNMAEENAVQSNGSHQLSTQAASNSSTIAPPSKPAVKPKAIVKEKVKEAVKPKPAVKEKAKATVKPETVVKAKPVVKTKTRPVKKAKKRSVTYNVKHSVTRNDKTIVNSRKKHEFRGGSHLFYPKLAKKGWFKASKKGESEITFSKPVALSKIIIHKASVGKLSFKNGYIHLEIKAPGSKKWKRLLERKDKDIDSKLTFRNIRKHMKVIESVRIRFKTYEPITIGPIDLIR